MNCIVCGSSQTSLKFKALKDLEYQTGSPIDFNECADCGLLSQKPLPQASQINDFYPAEYRNYLPIGSGLFSQLKKIKFLDQAKKLSSFFESKSAKVLEIGYGNGELLIAFKNLGYQNLYGCDFSASAAARLIQHGIRIQVANVEQAIPFDEQFDVIILNNVIEHFLNPLAVIKNCYAKLKPEGRLILFTPNSEAIEFKFFGKYWAGLHVPRHIYLFNKRNLELVVHNAGFSTVEFHDDVDPAQWAISMQNTLQDTTFFRTKLRNGMSFYMVLLSLLCIPIALLQKLLGNSTGLMCVAGK